jgi:hypothetical protein
MMVVVMMLNKSREDSDPPVSDTDEFFESEFLVSSQQVFEDVDGLRLKMVSNKDNVGSRLLAKFGESIEDLDRVFSSLDILVEQVEEKKRLANLSGRAFSMENKTKFCSVFVDFLNFTFGGIEGILLEGSDSNRLSLGFERCLLNVIKLVDSGNEVFLSDGNNRVHELKAAKVSEVVDVTEENSIMFILVVDSNDMFRSFLALSNLVLLCGNCG